MAPSSPTWMFEELKAFRAGWILPSFRQLVMTASSQEGQVVFLCNWQKVRYFFMAQAHAEG
jgi:hypothetical protein